jgi:CheY-like chemotaxis protein
LGLTISKKLVELLGGVIEVETRVGKGSVFSTEITFDKPGTPEKTGNQTAATKPILSDISGMKILVAEDNTINAMVLTRFLNRWNAVYTIARDGNEVMECLKKEDFDIVLMDIQMPNMDGREATQIIRKSVHEAFRDIPVIAFTADASIDSHRELLNTGFNDCLTKPFNPEQLLHLLKAYYTTQ